MNEYFIIILYVVEGSEKLFTFAWFPSLEKCLERNGLENSYLILT